MQFVKEVEIVFKTRKEVTIPATYFRRFKLDNISRSVIQTIWIVPRKQANIVVMEISQKVNEMLDKTTMIGIDERGIISHITAANDITAIVLYYHDGMQETLCVDYHMDFEDANPYQKTYVDESGNVYIVIAKDKHISDFFNKQPIDNSNSVPD